MKYTFSDFLLLEISQIFANNPLFYHVEGELIQNLNGLTTYLHNPEVHARHYPVQTTEMLLPM
jgi:hypothetical protein